MTEAFILIVGAWLIVIVWKTLTAFPRFCLGLSAVLLGLWLLSFISS